MLLSTVVPINRLLINNCKSISVKYIKYAAFPPAPYHTQLGINDAYLTSPLVCLQGNQSHIFLQTSFFSSFLISSAIQLYKPEIQELLDPHLVFHHHIQSITKSFNLTSLIYLTLIYLTEVDFSLPQPPHYFIISFLHN